MNSIVVIPSPRITIGISAAILFATRRRADLHSAMFFAYTKDLELYQMLKHLIATSFAGLHATKAH